ncbi:MAG TPA: NYN domain-containing protein [Streptosporangiaceae bacterium]
MDRCALFVDAGYALADGALAVHGTRHRDSVSWDYAGLLKLLASVSRDRTGLQVLRCYWYETTVDSRRTAEHETLADIPGLKLRLGKLRPGRREGVETEIRRDLTALARNKAVSDVVIVSAEEDLAQVISDVQDQGIRVALVHIAADGNWTIARALRQECDDLIEISASHLRPYVDLIPGAEPAVTDSQVVTSASGPANGTSRLAIPAQAQPARAQPAGASALYPAPVGADYARASRPPDTPAPAGTTLSVPAGDAQAGQAPAAVQFGSAQPDLRPPQSGAMPADAVPSGAVQPGQGRPGQSQFDQGQFGPGQFGQGQFGLAGQPGGQDQQASDQQSSRQQGSGGSGSGEQNAAQQGSGQSGLSPQPAGPEPVQPQAAAPGLPGQGAYPGASALAPGSPANPGLTGNGRAAPNDPAASLGGLPAGSAAGNRQPGPQGSEPGRELLGRGRDNGDPGREQRSADSARMPGQQPYQPSESARLGLPQNGFSPHGLPAAGMPSGGTPSNGFPSNGLPQNGLPSNGLQNGQSNGQQSNGLPQNGLSHGLAQNGLPSNGTPSNGGPQNGLPGDGFSGNGLPSRGLPSNGLPANGIPGNGLPGNGLPGNGAYQGGAHQGSSPRNGLPPGGFGGTNLPGNGLAQNGYSQQPVPPQGPGTGEHPRGGGVPQHGQTGPQGGQPGATQYGNPLSGPHGQRPIPQQRQLPAGSGSPYPPAGGLTSSYGNTQAPYGGAYPNTTPPPVSGYPPQSSGPYGIPQGPAQGQPSQPGLPQPGVSQPGLQQPARGQQGYPQPGLSQPALPQSAHNLPAHNQPALPQPIAISLADAVQAAHAEGFGFGEAVARDAPALWLEAVLARKPRMPSDLEARLLQGSALPIDSLLHDEVRHSLRRGFWDALERSRR